MCLILMQSLHVHVHAHGTSVSILVGEHFCFLSLQLLSTSFYGESCIFSVDSWCSQYTGSGNYCQISTTRQAAMLKHKCMKPVLSAQILMYSFYQRFQSHFTSVMSVARFCCSTPMAHQKLGRAISKLWSVGVMKILHKPQCTAQLQVWSGTASLKLLTKAVQYLAFADKHAHCNYCYQDTVLIFLLRKWKGIFSLWTVWCIL